MNIQEEMNMVERKENELSRIKNNGITLVALVVTIVVLLILAGITITLLFGNNGIITKASDAKEKTESAMLEEQEGLSDLEDKMAQILGEDTSGLAKLIKNGGKVEENTTVTDKTGKEITIPGGYTVTAETAEIDKGVVIKDESGNEFVWVPVSAEQLSTMFGTDGTVGTDGNENYLGKLYNFGTSTAPNNPPVAYNWTETDGIMSWTLTRGTGSYREPDIVTYCDGSDAIINASYFTAAISTTMTGSEFKTQLQNEFNAMKTSVETYKGFYIGRYETGNLSSSDTTNTPVVQRGNTLIASANWYYMYQESKNIASNDNVTSSMIWGCQWDRTLQWLVESGNKTYAEIVDSSTWGNYSNYSSTTGDTSTSSGSPQPTGTNEAWKANNIYDMAGNVYDWTIEAFDTFCRVGRRRQLRLFRF